MHAVVVTVTINDPETAMSQLREVIVPGASQSPGFVAGYWIGLGPEKGGRSVIVFESEDAARNFADQHQAPPDAPVRIESIDVGEVVAHA